jgi:DNA-binding response OmpR family regulator
MVVEDAHTPVLDSCIRALRKRIEMVLRAREMQAVNFSNGLQINYANLKVSVNNRPVDLTSGEFSVLAVLSRHPKRFVGFASIRDEIFLSSSNSNLDLRENADANNFSVLIYRLRKKLGPDEQPHQHYIG